MRRHVVRDHGASTGDGALPDGHWRPQDAVRADERAIADDRPVLAPTVVVGRDGTRPDVDARADLGITEVAEVVLLGPRAERRGLDLREIADLRGGPDPCARPEVRERAHTHVVFDGRRLQHAGPDRAALADDGIDQLRSGPDDSVPTHLRRAPQDDVGLEGHIRGQLDRGIDVGRGRIGHGHARPHQPVIDFASASPAPRRRAATGR